jgi:hypothetical protein
MSERSADVRRIMKTAFCSTTKTGINRSDPSWSDTARFELQTLHSRVVWLAQDGHVGSCPVNFAPDCSATEIDLGLGRYDGDIWIGSATRAFPGKGHKIPLLAGNRVRFADLGAQEPGVFWLGDHRRPVNGLTADTQNIRWMRMSASATVPTSVTIRQHVPATPCTARASPHHGQPIPAIASC